MSAPNKRQNLRRKTKEPEVLTVAEAAQLLRVGPAAAYTAVRMKQIPSLRLGCKIMIPAAALRKLLETAA
jgi:excisionase family DNA binding protein